MAVRRTRRSSHSNPMGSIQIHSHAHAGSEPQNGANVSGNLGLEKSNPHPGRLSQIIAILNVPMGGKRTLDATSSDVATSAERVSCHSPYEESQKRKRSPISAACRPSPSTSTEPSEPTLALTSGV